MINGRPVHSLVIALCASCYAEMGAGAQTLDPLPLPRLTAPVVIDGVLDDEGWKTIPALPLTMYAPVFRGAPEQRTIIKVAYDDEYFYAAGWFFDSDPSGVRVNSLYRDRWNGDDAFAIYIDPFDDKRNAKWFGTTPGGIRFDQLISDDGRTINDTWDTFWLARTTVTHEGWFAEVRIPFSSIGFRADTTGRAVMGLLVTRLVARTGERVVFPAIDPRFDFRRPSVEQDVMLDGVHTHRPVYVTPYALAGVARSLSPTAAAPFAMQSRPSREGGLDVRYPASSQLTIDLTANTDFAQAEADDQQVNLDRFPLFYPERRRFFQEGSGVFDFVMVNGTRLFNSRTIGLTADARPVPVLGGARVVGRLGGWDVGALSMQTASQDSSPRAAFTVARFRHELFNPGSTLGGMITRYNAANRVNTSAGVDGVVQVAPDQYITFKWAGSDGQRDSLARSLVDRSQIDLLYARRVERGLQYDLTLSRSGPSFDPGLGFVQRSNFTTANVGGNYYFFTDQHPFLRRVYPGALAFTTFRNADHALESAQYAVWVEWDTKAGGGGWVEPKLFHENVLAPFSISSKVSVPQGSYDFADLQTVLTMSSGAKLRTSIDARAGTYFDGRRVQVVAKPVWNVSPHLELGTDYQLTRLTFPVRDQADNIQIVRGRVRAALDARLSANAFVQFNSVTHQINLNARVRYAFAEGTDLWIVYDEGLDTDRALADPGEPRSPLSVSRTLLLKYTRTFGF